MPDYLLVGRGGSIGETQEDWEALGAAFGSWFASIAHAIVHPGDSLIPPTSVGPDGPASAPPDDMRLGGFCVISVSSLDEALAIARSSPKISVEGGTMDVYELRGVTS